MKILLSTLNSKYSHTSPALRYLQSNLKTDGEVAVREYTINDDLDHVLMRLYEQKADVYAFSTYIWNGEETVRLVRNLKKIRPDVRIVLGGPEASNRIAEFLEESKADYIIRGEGEVAFQKLITAFEKGSGVETVPGLSHIKDGRICNNPLEEPIDLDKLPFLYEDAFLSDNKEKIIYYESSRGCPYRCAYCMSATDRKVRNRSVEKVKEDLKRFIDSGVRQVKFVDRTFNLDRERTLEILQFILDYNKGTNFHFEIAADLLEEEAVDVLNRMPKGFVQLEVGVQTTNQQVLQTINRASDLSKIREKVKKVKEGANVHLHLDLIAGLPGEDFSSFETSFNQVLDLNPDKMQLGFLKVLPGSPMTGLVKDFGIVFRKEAPYEVLQTRDLSFDEMMVLKRVEHMVEKYYDSGSYENTIRLIRESLEITWFEFFRQLAGYYEKEGYFERKTSKDEHYRILKDCFIESFKGNPLYASTLKIDYLQSNPWPVPAYLSPKNPRKEIVFEMLKSADFIERLLPDFKGKSAKEIYKNVHFEIFDSLRGDPLVGLFRRKADPFRKKKNEMIPLDAPDALILREKLDTI